MRDDEMKSNILSEDTNEIIFDDFDRKIKDGLTAALDTDDLCVSEELIAKTMAAIRAEAAGASKDSMEEKTEEAVKVTDLEAERKRRNLRVISKYLASAAAVFIVVIVGLRFMGIGASYKSAAPANTENGFAGITSDTSTKAEASLSTSVDGAPMLEESSTDAGELSFDASVAVTEDNCFTNESMAEKPSDVECEESVSDNLLVEATDSAVSGGMLNTSPAPEDFLESIFTNTSEAEINADSNASDDILEDDKLLTVLVSAEELSQAPWNYMDEESICQVDTKDYAEFRQLLIAQSAEALGYHYDAETDSITSEEPGCDELPSEVLYYDAEEEIAAEDISMIITNEDEDGVRRTMIVVSDGVLEVESENDETTVRKIIINR